MSKFDWKAAVSDVISTFAGDQVRQADQAAQKNIVLAFVLGGGLIAFYFLMKRGR